MRALLLFIAASGVFAQSFEAASVKPSKAGNFNYNMNTRRDNIRIDNGPLREIILEAFNIKDYQLVGPDWLNSQRFDIVAKAPLGTGDDEKLDPLLRNLLIERFKLRTHRETRDLPCYALVIAKGGIRFKESASESGSMSTSTGDGGGELTARKADMDSLAEWLSRFVDRPVLDRTGLKGQFDISLKYSKESAKGQTDSPTHPVVTLAIQEQLGLRLEKRTAPIQMLIIDHAEKVPVEN